MASESVSEKKLKPEAALQTATTDKFGALLTKAFRPRTADEAADIRAGVEMLARAALTDVNLVSANVIRVVQDFIAEFDRKLTTQVNLILHHPEFQKLEGAWRGLYYLVNNTETDDMLMVRFINITKDEITRVFDKYEGTLWDQSPIFKKIYTNEYSMLGGHPYGCLIGDYQFDNSPSDVALLANMANICAAAHVPFISAASPSLFGMQSWQELMDPTDLTKKTNNVAYAKWTSLRKSEDARYVGLTLPRVLARLPYGAKTKKIDAFDFEEDVAGTDHHRYCWMNSAYAMGVNINRSFKLYGWCTRIRGVESGGTVLDLPVHTFPTDDGGVAMKCPTEIAIDQRRESELGSLGLMPLIHRKNTDQATFIGAQMLKLPEEYYNPNASANANLSARLPYLFAACRFAVFLKKIMVDKIGTFKEREGLENYLQDWISNYVDNNPNFSSDEIKASKPLREAQVTVEPVPGNPGYYSTRFYLRPHYQFEGADVALSLVSVMPTAKAGA